MLGTPSFLRAKCRQTGGLILSSSEATSSNDDVSAANVRSDDLEESFANKKPHSGGPPSVLDRQLEEMRLNIQRATMVRTTDETRLSQFAQTLLKRVS
jgi:hypothetical protein